MYIAGSLNLASLVCTLSVGALFFFFFEKGVHTARARMDYQEEERDLLLLECAMMGIYTALLSGDDGVWDHGIVWHGTALDADADADADAGKPHLVISSLFHSTEEERRRGRHDTRIHALGR